MNGKTYSIKEVAGMLEIEAYVLRYYEKELELTIGRNSQGHRSYNAQDVDLLRQIKELREQGLELKAVKNVLHTVEDDGLESLIQMSATTPRTATIGAAKINDIDITDQGDDRVKQFSLMMKEMLKQALSEYNGTTKEELKEELTVEMNTMVNKKMREIEVAQKEKDETYYNHMTETMREMQKMQKELASLQSGQSKSGFWKKLFTSKEEEENAKKEQSM